MTARANEFIFVRCSDLKTASEVKASRPPEAVFLDCDGDRILATGVSDHSSILSAMDRALQTWCDKPVTWTSINGETLAEAKKQNKLFVIYFADDEKKESQENEKAFEHRAIAKHHSKIFFVKVPFEKNSEAAKLWNVNGAPATLVVDPNKEIGTKAILDRLTGKQKVQAIRASLLKNFKKVAKETGKP